MSDEPTVEEICQRRGRIHGPWRQGAVERFHVFTPDGATMAHERVLLRMNEHFAYEADADFIAHAPSDIAWLLERDAARETRLAELEAELAEIKATPEESCEQLVRDVAAALKRDRIGLNRAVDASGSEIVGAANVVSEHFAAWRARLFGERVPELADIDKHAMAALDAEKRAGRAELELLEIRERARAEIRKNNASIARMAEEHVDCTTHDYFEEMLDAEMSSKLVAQIAGVTDEPITESPLKGRWARFAEAPDGENVVGDLGEPAAREGEGDA